MGRIEVVMACLVGTGLLLHCAAPPAPEDPALLVLGGEAVRRSDFERHVRQLEARDGPLSDTVRATLLQSFLEERVLVLEARRNGLVGVHSTAEDERTAVEELLGLEVMPAVSVSEEQVLAYYQDHKDELRSAETVTLRQILVTTLNEARDVRRRLYKDKRSFELLARTRSRSPEASRGGLMGIFERGQLPAALETAAFALSPGRVSSIVETPLGFHVLMVDERSEARERTLEECREEIHTELMRQAYDAALRRYIAGLVARAEVKT